MDHPDLPRPLDPDDAASAEILEIELAEFDRVARKLLGDLGMPTPEAMEAPTDLGDADEAAWKSYQAEVAEATTPKDDGIRAHRAVLTCLWVRAVRQHVEEGHPAAAAYAALKLRVVAGDLLKDAETFTRGRAKGTGTTRAKSEPCRAEIREIDARLRRDRPLLHSKASRANVIADKLRTAHPGETPLSASRIRKLI